MWEMLKEISEAIRDLLDRGCFDSADVGDVEIIGKVERSRGLKTYKRSPIF